MAVKGIVMQPHIVRYELEKEINGYNAVYQTGGTRGLDNSVIKIPFEEARDKLLDWKAIEHTRLPSFNLENPNSIYQTFTDIAGIIGRFVGVTVEEMGSEPQVAALIRFLDENKDENTRDSLDRLVSDDVKILAPTYIITIYKPGHRHYKEW